MFTGLITDIGEIVGIDDAPDLRRISIACSYPADGIALGASIACSGPCLTAVEIRVREGRTVFDVQAGPETLLRTTAGSWVVGTKLNLERSLKIGDELGGHIVTGHVDGTASLIERIDVNGTARFLIRAPASLARFIAEKGSISLDGTSLTVNGVSGNDLSVLLIPHTLAVTTWGMLKTGERLNIEVDLMARYAARLVEAREVASI